MKVKKECLDIGKKRKGLHLFSLKEIVKKRFCCDLLVSPCFLFILFTCLLYSSSLYLIDAGRWLPFWVIASNLAFHACCNIAELFCAVLAFLSDV